MTVNFKSKVTSNNTNTAYVSKTANDEKTGTLGLNDGGSTQILDTQDFINQVADSSGETEGDANRKTYSSEEIIANGDNKKVAIGKLDAQVKTNLDDITANEGRITDIEDDYGQPNGLATLNGSGKVPSDQLPTNMMEFLGDWDASTNTPTLSDTDINALGGVYRTTVAGTVDFGAGNISFKVGDWCYNNGSVWGQSDEQSIPDTDALPEGSVNFYYTEGRVTANASVTANTAKVTNATHIGEVTGSTSLAVNKIAITNKSTVTGVAGDFILISDTSDAGNLKKIDLSDLLASAGSGVKKIGFDGTIGSAVVMGTNHHHATRVTSPLGATITRLGVLLGSNTAGRNLIMGIYSDNAGVPGALLAQTSEYAVAVGGSEARFRYFDLDGSVNLVEDTDYWITTWSDNNCAVESSFNNTSSGGQVYRNVTYSTTLPDPFGTITSNSGGHLSVAGY